MKNILFEQEKNEMKCNFMENKTEFIQDILKVKQISLLPK